MDVKQLRNKLKLNQTQFWSRVGVTQSGGSRYESGRNVPRAVQTLISVSGATVMGLPRPSV